jgi:insecticidal toxin complex protein TccC
MGMDLHRHTPNLTVIDSRGLAVRKVAFHCASANGDITARTTAIHYTAAGYIAKLWDPRLLAIAQMDEKSPPNRTHIYSLSGLPLFSDSVDAGWDLALLRESGVVDQSWDSKGASWRSDYDELLRPVAMHETSADQPSRQMARCVYADQGADYAVHNQCGQIIEASDSAGRISYPEFGILGQPLQEVRQFLKGMELPDWSGSPELDLKEHNTVCSFSALGELLTQTDASGNRQRFASDISGAMQRVYLQLNGASEASLLQGITYNAQGQVECETAGNGVVSTADYDPITERLERLSATNGTQAVQALSYQYDPVGNVLEVNDNAQAKRYFANQEVEPANRFEYDSLYQLIAASGRESVDSSDTHYPTDPAPNPGDTSQLLNYTEQYQYDAGGNMTELRHVRAGNNYTRAFVIAPTSNRGLRKAEGVPTPDFDTAFDLAGNLVSLQPGQTLEWNVRNQLRKITAITRQGSSNDDECYAYDGDDQRVRKLRTFLTQSTVRQQEVRYLPGLEIRTTGTDSITDEHLEIITVQAGRQSVRCLHWVSGKPADIPNDQLRYSLGDHLGSSSIELDQDANLISHEGYLPFGGTAWWAGKSALEANYKTIRYSGKERDASGLYYYGYRYYAPWLQRWVNPDPAGDIDGLNLYRMVANNPITQADSDGRMTEGDYIIMQDTMEAPVQAHEILRRESVSPEGKRDKQLSENSRNYGVFPHAVYLHIKSLKLIERRLNIVSDQLDSMTSTYQRLKKGGAFVLGQIARGGAVGVSGLLAGTLASISVPVTTLAVATAAGTAADAAVASAFERLNIFQPSHLHTSPLEPDKIRTEVLTKAKTRGRMGHATDKLNPSTYSALQNTELISGIALGEWAGVMAQPIINIVKVADDFSSSAAGKMNYKLDQLNSYLDIHILSINKTMEHLNEYAPFVMPENTTIRVGIKRYTSKDIQTYNDTVVKQLKSVKKKLERTQYNISRVQ